MQTYSPELYTFKISYFLLFSQSIFLQHSSKMNMLLLLCGSDARVRCAETAVDLQTLAAI